MAILRRNCHRGSGPCTQEPAAIPLGLTPGKGSDQYRWMRFVASLVDLVLKLFTLGLFIRMVLSWVRIGGLYRFERFLDQFYAPFLSPLRRLIRPLPMGGSPPVALDLAPLVLLLLIWLAVHPFLMWVLR